MQRNVKYWESLYTLWTD